MPQQLQVRGILTRFLTDEMPLVRSIVVEVLAALAADIDMYSIKWLFFVLETSLKDTSHRVRNKVLEICYRIAQALFRATEATKEAGGDNQAVLQELHLHRCKLLPFVNASAEDPEWQVRAAYAYFCPGFVDYFGEQWSTVFIDALESLMRDPEMQVRRLAIDSVPKIAESWLPNSVGGQTAARSKERILDSLLPGFMRLVSDPSLEVRVSVAGATGKLLRLLAELRDEAYEEVMDDKVVQVMTPLMQRILHDDVPQEVALSLLEFLRVNMEEVDAWQLVTRPPVLLVPSQVELLLPALSHLSTNPHWRLRRAIVECLPMLQLIVVPLSPMDDNLINLWGDLILDSVESVRRTAGESMCLTWHLMHIIAPPPPDPSIAAAQGRDGMQIWLDVHVLPMIFDCMNSPTFKQRLLGLHMAVALLRLTTPLPPEKAATVWELLFELAADRVANVRIALVRALEDLIPFPPSQDLLAREHLQTLTNDNDRDVRYFATKSLTKLVSTSGSKSSIIASGQEEQGVRADETALPKAPLSNL